LMYKSKGTLISKLKMEGRHVKNWTAALEYWRHLLPVINFKYESESSRKKGLSIKYGYTDVFVGTSPGDIVQLAMDEERSVLYALTKSSKIISFMVEPDDTLSAIQTIENPIGQANSAIGGFSSFYQNNVSVISLSVIPRKESSTYRLMAILSSGESRLDSLGGPVYSLHILIRRSHLFQASVSVWQYKPEHRLWPRPLSADDVWRLPIRQPIAYPSTARQSRPWEIY